MEVADQSGVSTRILRSKRLLSAIGIGVLAVFIFGLVLARRPEQSIPRSVIGQAGYVVIAPSKESQIQVDKPTIKFDQSTKQLSYNFKTAEGQAIIASQQPTPVTFSDVPEVYQKLLDRMNQYDSFETTLGKVYLTKPGNLGVPEAEVAVVNTAGTLTFLRSDKHISTDAWRAILLDLDLIK